MTSPSWPADAVSRRSVAELFPAARNARTHSDAQIAQIVASIREWGWTMPVLVDEAGQIIAGHGRVMAARSMGLVDVPTMVAVGWTAEQKRAYLLADNKLGLNSGWDDDVLRAELGELKIGGFDLGKIGFSGDELSVIFDPGAGFMEPKTGAGNLAAKFGVPPFSVLNAREGWWQDRKRAWLALGIQSELGRGLPDDSDSSFTNQGAQRALQDGRPHRKPNAVPGGAPMPLDRQAKPSQTKPSQAKQQRHPRGINDAGG